MKASVYNEMSKTAEGRKEVYGMMVSEIEARINGFIVSAPAANKEKVSEIMMNALAKIKEIGIGDMFRLFAEEGISDRNFLDYLNLALRGKL